jgi:hypothetical protein
MALAFVQAVPACPLTRGVNQDLQRITNDADERKNLIVSPARGP